MLKTQGYAAADAHTPLAPFSFERRDPRPHDVALAIQYCGICHSDIHQVRSEWGAAIYPMVPGHEIVGVVTAIGDQVSRFKVGDRVGVGCFVDSCRQCDPCKQGEECYCTKGAVFTYNNREYDGAPTMGGYSNNIVVDENYVLRIPQNLPPDACAPLLCAGITCYSPLRHWQIGPGKKVAIVGLGGLGHMGVKLAHAMGAEVTVLSHSRRKQEDAKRLGADSFYATTEPETFQKLKGSFDLILNTVSSNLDWSAYLDLLRLNGSMVVLGVADQPSPVAAFSLIHNRRSLSGSLIGGIRETQEMLDFCGQHGIVSEIERIPIQKVNEAYERVLKSDVRYRFVIDMASLHAE